jgi:DNA-directed RNA polymerase beta subunit
MAKQAVSIHATNFTDRYDTIAHLMTYPERAIVRTRLSRYLNSDKLPASANTIVAIMSYSGFNQVRDRAC